MPQDNGLDEAMSVERKAAEMSFNKAKEQLKRGRHEDAIEHAREALREDPSYLDVRRWLGQLYEEMDELPRASREYQEVIQTNSDDEEAWEGLRRVDEDAAERLERLHDIAPDPFVAQRQRAVDDDMFAAIGEDEEEEEEEEEEYEETEADAVSEAAEREAEEVAEEIEAEAEPATAPPTEQVPWASEQDYEFRQRLMARPGISGMVESFADMAADYDAWETALVGCAHLDKARHAKVHELVEELAEFFGVELPEMFIAPERRMTPAIISGDPVMVAITTGMLSALSEAGLRFAIGRLIAHLVLEDIMYQHLAIAILQRSPTSTTDCEEAMGDLLVRTAVGWDVGVSREEMNLTRKIAHAWQLRAVLSADRGGLLACRDVQEACLAIAQGTARDSDKAAEIPLEDFIAGYRDQDPGQLAAIDQKEDPLRSGPYAAYRILMLRWWAARDQYRQLSGT